MTADNLMAVVEATRGESFQDQRWKKSINLSYLEHYSLHLSPFRPHAPVVCSLTSPVLLSLPKPRPSLTVGVHAWGRPALTVGVHAWGRRSLTVGVHAWGRRSLTVGVHAWGRPSLTVGVLA